MIFEQCVPFFLQKLDNLMIISLNFSKDLIEIPDLSNAPNLEIVSLHGCESLCQVHPSVFTCPKLRYICLNGCKKIESLKANIHSKSLQSLNLTDCSSLVEFSVTSEEMTILLLCGTAIHEFPSSMWRNSKLTYINLSQCKKLNIVGKKLSNDRGLGSHTFLTLSGCTQINASNLWFILDGIPSLKNLCLRECCNLETLPDNIQNNSMLEILNLDECRNLKSLPNLPISLRQLTAVNCTYLDTNSILQNMLHRLAGAQFSDEFDCDTIDASIVISSFFPGAQVPYEFRYHTTEASIVIPNIPKYGLACFIVCIILSEGLYVTDYDSSINCTIYENKKLVHTFFEGVGASGTLISDHVLLLSLSYDNFKSVEVGSESQGDHYNLSFEFKYKGYDDEKRWSTKGIKGCGIIPIHGLEHSLGLDGRNNSGVEIVELQSSVQVFDESDQHLKFHIDELQHQVVGPGAEVGGSTNENEYDRQQLLIPPKKRRRT
jgi:hypothetical protein